jgi:hypothetical protein
MRRIERSARAAQWLAIGCVALAFIAVSWFAVATLLNRPLEYVEGEVLFNASRLRDQLKLYVDPMVGAFDYGPVPARYYVAYVPIWAWVLSHLPADSAAPLARGVDLCAWYGMLAWIAWRSPIATRRIACLAAVLVASRFTLTYYAASARPDTIAVVLAGIALWRGARDRRVDAWGGVLFALAAWTKPNVVGMAWGALLWPLVSRRDRDYGALLGALMTSAALIVLLQIVTSGEWLRHLFRSTCQPLSLVHLRHELSPVVGLCMAPLGLAAWWGARTRHDLSVRVAFPSLLTSIGWTLLSLSKYGTAGNHWLEPSLAAAILVARSPALHVTAASRPVLILVVAIQGCVSACVSVHDSLEEALLSPRRTAFISRARKICGAEPGDLVLAPDVGIEYMINGRIIATPFEMTYLVRRGLYPLSLWIADLESPRVRGIVMENDVLERPSQTSTSYDRLDPSIREALGRRFVFAEEQAGLRVYRLRRRDDRPSEKGHFPRVATVDAAQAAAAP